MTRELSAAAREARENFYIEVIDGLVMYLTGAEAKKISSASSQEEKARLSAEYANSITAFISRTQARMMLRASAVVNKRWADVIRAAKSGKVRTMTEQMDRLVMAMREEMGYDNEDLRPGDLMGVFGS